MMARTLMLACLALTACATPPNNAACPALPEMSSDQTVSAYTVQVVNLYQTCRGSK